MVGAPLASEPRRPGGNQYIPRPADWRPGGAAPWPVPAPPVPVADLAGRVRAAAHVGSFEPDFPDARPSAVLALFADGPDGAEVLLTRRAMHLSSHKGEVSFPGGRLEPGEDYEAAALREADEEVGLDPSLVTVVGRLQPISTYVSRSWIVPVVGWVASRPQLDLRPAEVDRVMWVPLRDLTVPGTFREEWWSTVSGDRPIFFFELDDETVWGATARMLHQLLRVAHGIEGPEPPAL